MTNPEKKDPEVINATTFIVDGKTVDANGKEVKAPQPAQPDAQPDTAEPAPKPATRSKP